MLSSIDNNRMMYNKIASWWKNMFLVLYGKTGRDFIEQ